MNTTIALLSVVSIWSIAVITPGPNLLITVQTTVNHSRLSGMFTVLGTCTGTIIWAVVGYFGIAYLFTVSPWFYITLKVAGGSYLIYLGVKSVISFYRSTTKVHEPQSRQQKLFNSWQTGLTTNLLNPKTAIFITSIFASALPKEPSLLIGMLSIILMTFISLLWYSIVVFLFSSEKISTHYGQIQNRIQGFAGAAFIVFGTKLLLDDK